uniref:Large ribosomal subunit protein bL9m n=1 Tax=Ornithodoros turicata TaxID=34597 RepID=A0A2R5LJC3_9ACAR
MLKNLQPITRTLLTKLHPVQRGQARTTVIVKRKFPVELTKLTDKHSRPLRKRHYVYEYDEITEQKKKENIDVILTRHVDGKGDKWDIISVPSYYAYFNLILPGYAMYASPENLELREKHKQKKIEAGPTFSSPYASLTIRLMETRTYNLSMNRDLPWTVEPWHVRVALRKTGVVVRDESVLLPETPIVGPDPSMQGKVFALNILVNGMDKAHVLMRINLTHKDYKNDPRVPYYESPVEALLPEQEQLVKELVATRQPATAALLENL